MEAKICSSIKSEGRLGQEVEFTAILDGDKSKAADVTAPGGGGGGGGSECFNCGEFGHMAREVEVVVEDLGIWLGNVLVEIAVPRGLFLLWGAWSHGEGLCEQEAEEAVSTAVARE